MKKKESWKGYCLPWNLGKSESAMAILPVCIGFVPRSHIVPLPKDLLPRVSQVSLRNFVGSFEKDARIDWAHPRSLSLIQFTAVSHLLLCCSHCTAASFTGAQSSLFLGVTSQEKVGVMNGVVLRLEVTKFQQHNNRFSERSMSSLGNHSLTCTFIQRATRAGNRHSPHYSIRYSNRQWNNTVNTDIIWNSQDNSSIFLIESWACPTPFQRERNSNASPKPCNTTHKSSFAQDIKSPGVCERHVFEENMNTYYGTVSILPQNYLKPIWKPLGTILSKMAIYKELHWHSKGIGLEMAGIYLPWLPGGLDWWHIYQTISNH